jgi:hypothetical protein
LNPASQGQIAEDAQTNAAASELDNPRGNRFGDRIDDVGAHRVADIDVEVHDQHAVVFVEDADVEIAATPAARHHSWNGFVGDLEDEITLGFDARLRRMRIGHVIELNLGGHDRRCRLTEESARHPHLSRCIRRSRHDRRLLDGHRHEHVIAVHSEVESDRKGQAVYPDHVFAHAVRDLEGEPPAVLQMPNGLFGKQPGVDHGSEPLFDVL